MSALCQKPDRKGGQDWLASSAECFESRELPSLTVGLLT